MALTSNNGNSFTFVASSHPSVVSVNHQPPLHYLPHDKFIDKIKTGEFIEYKVVEVPDMHYIGVSKSAVKDVINSQATCVLSCQPKVMKSISFPVAVSDELSQLVFE